MLTSWLDSPDLASIFPSLLILLFLGLFALAACYFRARTLPQCCRCGAMKVRRSQLRRWSDRFAAMLLLSPYRCSGCRARFYAPRAARVFL